MKKCLKIGVGILSGVVLTSAIVTGILVSQNNSIKNDKNVNVQQNNVEFFNNELNIKNLKSNQKNETNYFMEWDNSVSSFYFESINGINDSLERKKVFFEKIPMFFDFSKNEKYKEIFEKYYSFYNNIATSEYFFKKNMWFDNGIDDIEYFNNTMKEIINRHNGISQKTKNEINNFRKKNFNYIIAYSDFFNTKNSGNYGDFFKLKDIKNKQKYYEIKKEFNELETMYISIKSKIDLKTVSEKYDIKEFQEAFKNESIFEYKQREEKYEENKFIEYYYIIKIKCNRKTLNINEIDKYFSLQNYNCDIDENKKRIYNEIKNKQIELRFKLIEMFEKNQEFIETKKIELGKISSNLAQQINTKNSILNKNNGIIDIKVEKFLKTKKRNEIEIKIENLKSELNEEIRNIQNSNFDDNKFKKQLNLLNTTMNNYDIYLNEYFSNISIDDIESSKEKEQFNNCNLIINNLYKEFNSILNEFSMILNEFQQIQNELDELKNKFNNIQNITGIENFKLVFDLKKIKNDSNFDWDVFKQQCQEWYDKNQNYYGLKDTFNLNDVIFNDLFFEEFFGCSKEYGLIVLNQILASKYNVVSTINVEYLNEFMNEKQNYNYLIYNQSNNFNPTFYVKKQIDSNNINTSFEQIEKQLIIKNTKKDDKSILEMFTDFVYKNENLKRLNTNFKNDKNSMYYVKNNRYFEVSIANYVQKNKEELERLTKCYENKDPNYELNKPLPKPEKPNYNDSSVNIKNIAIYTTIALVGLSTIIGISVGVAKHKKKNKKQQTTQYIQSEMYNKPTYYPDPYNQNKPFDPNDPYNNWSW